MDKNLINKIESNIEKLIKLGKVDEAKALRNELKKYSGDKPEDEFGLEEVIDYIKKKDTNKVIEYLRNKCRNREYGDVIKICNYWLEVNQSNAFANYFLGLAFNGLEDYEKAIIHHKTAMELNPNFADIARGVSKYKGNYQEKEVSCIGCGENKAHVVNISNQSISEDNKELINPLRVWKCCSKCGLIYASPAPDENTLNQYYDIISKEKFGGIYGNIDDRFEPLVGMANKRLERIERILGERGTLLDIGTGIGLFVGVALDKGWDATGLEFNKRDCEYAKNNFDIELIQKNFYDFSEEEVYSVVSLFEVIEHLSNPLKDLKQISKLVKPNGVFVLATPIQDSLYGKKAKEQNIFWNVITHLSYFKKIVMINYLEEAGFDIIEMHESDEGMGRMEFYCKKR